MHVRVCLSCLSKTLKAALHARQARCSARQYFWAGLGRGTVRRSLRATSMRTCTAVYRLESSMANTRLWTWAWGRRRSCLGPPCWKAHPTLPVWCYCPTQKSLSWLSHDAVYMSSHVSRPRVVLHQDKRRELVMFKIFCYVLVSSSMPTCTAVYRLEGSGVARRTPGGGHGFGGERGCAWGRPA
jgi:hypothetical protein